MASSRLRKFGIIALGGGGVAAATYGLTQFLDNSKSVVLADTPQRPRPNLPLLSRADQLKALKETPEYDVLIIGGGATGAGVALDSVTRGFKTALVDMDDFSSGTSSRSTKLIHGGVRYLQKAIMNFDTEQYKMVKEALHERANLLKIAPHLSAPLPIMLPVYRWWQVPYYWVGIKAYDFVAGTQQVKSSYFLTKTQALERFPMLKKDNLCGALVYYDGQHNDARMNLSIVLTSARYGANIVNHTAVVELLKSKDENGKERISGAVVKDMITGNQFEVRAKCVVNATGPFTDNIRQMDDINTPKICQPSAGVHIILPDYYSPANMGLLDPATSDGRVIFFLPWEKATIAGTTDRPCEVTHSPCPTEGDIQFILNEVRHYLSPDIEVRRGDVLSAWSGIRPLVLDPNKKNTESIARNHIINVSDKGLVTVAGGKWTTYRIMAKETMEAAIETCPKLKPEKDCQTDGLYLEGGHNWTPIMFIRLVQDYGLENEVAQHLANTYGDRAFTVAKLARVTGKRWPVLGKRLHEEFPYLEAEVRYAVREYACTAIDIIARRMRLAFLNSAAAEEALPRIIEIMAEELKWSKSEQKTQHEKATEFLHKEMGQQMSAENWEELPVSFTSEEINTYTRQFNSLDKEHKGYISINDLRRIMRNSGEKVSEQQLHDILNEVDLDKNGVVELAEYLQLMNAIKHGAVSSSRLAKAAEMEYTKISVERSGGGL